MNNLFRHAATRHDVPAIHQWKEAGGRVVGHTCSFMPLEILDAAGILPVRLRGIGTTEMHIGDTYFGPFVCRYPKALLQLVGDGTYDYLDGAVVSTGCDAMRRMDDCWRKLAEDAPGTLPPFFHYFDVPQKVEPHARDWFAGQVRKLISALEAHFGVTISDRDLARAIRARNRVRGLLWELELLRRNIPARVSGTEAFAAVLAGAVLPPELFANELESALARIRDDMPDAQQGRRRVLVGGSISDDLELIEMVEDSGAVVVADNLCFGVRHASDRVEEGRDPVEALSERYLSRSVCPRMFGNYKTRLAGMREKIGDAGVDGVILENVRFCDLHGSENGLLEHDLEASGIPCIRVEREYGPFSDTGRLNMRVGAFVEQLRNKEGEKHAS
ncbi:MAG: 2-hydroxyacyl-CoA dehydratase subunit D [Desulfatibacillaceae bacterium]